MHAYTHALTLRQQEQVLWPKTIRICTFVYLLHYCMIDAIEIYLNDELNLMHVHMTDTYIAIRI